MTTKNQYWQVVRAICILAVVMIHCPTSTSDINTWLIIRQFINFPVAVFIFLSGYFVNPDKVSIKWVKIRGGGRLLLPYLIWSIAFIGIGIVRNGLDIKHIIYCLLTGKAAAPFYYIVVLLQLLVITPWLVKNRKTWMYFITPIYLVLVYVYNIINGKMPLFYETLFLAWFFFYLLGLDCRAGKLNNVVHKVRSWGIVIALVASIGEAFLLMAVGCSAGFACSQIRFSSFAYAAVIALWLVKNEKMTERNLLSRIGDYSYGIFYVHMIFMMVVTKGLSIIGLDTIWILYWGLSFCIVSIMSIITVRIGRRIMKNKLILRAIGFE